nr:class I SAM-dependent methyltransferase [Spirosomataceae bacterium]
MYKELSESYRYFGKYCNMIGKRLEYEKMYAVERQLWWYRILHQNVQTAIQTYFPDKNIAILDAGCGTGGLLTSLQSQGYTQLSGFDGSADAVEFCQARGLNVAQHNLTHIEAFSPANPLDVIICDDVFCYLTDDEILRVMRCFKNWLKPNGIFISNNNA